MSGPEKAPEQTASQMETTSVVPDQQVEKPGEGNKSKDLEGIKNQRTESSEELSDQVESTKQEEILEEIEEGGETAAKTDASAPAAQPAVAPKTIWNQAETGIGWTVEKLAGAATTIGGFMNKIWENIKPHIRKIATMPGLSFVLGAENVKKLQEWFGYNPAMIEVETAVRDRIDPDIGFTIADSRELTAFNDRYDRLIRVRNATPSSYPKGAFVAELKGEGFLKLDEVHVDDNGKKTLTMDQLTKAADALIEKVEQEKKEKEDDEEKKKKSDSDAS